MASTLDQGQIIQNVHDTTTSALKVKSVSDLIDKPYDYVAVTYPLTTREVYTFKTGGSGGTTVYTITINYSDATKVNITNVART